jgi:hypothetical protein
VTDHIPANERWKPSTPQAILSPRVPALLSRRLSVGEPSPSQTRPPTKQTQRTESRQNERAKIATTGSASSEKKLRHPVTAKAASQPMSYLSWQVRGQANYWNTPADLNVETREAMQAYVDHIHTDPRFQARCRNGNTLPLCFGCQIVEENSSSCDNEEDTYVACANCIHTGKQPCGRLIKYFHTKESYFIGFVPLPTEERGDATWNQLAYWVRPSPTKSLSL